jgi:hypothetical protein
MFRITQKEGIYYPQYGRLLFGRWKAWKYYRQKGIIAKFIFERSAREFFNELFENKFLYPVEWIHLIEK